MDEWTLGIWIMSAIAWSIAHAVSNQKINAPHIMFWLAAIAWIIISFFL